MGSFSKKGSGSSSSKTKKAKGPKGKKARAKAKLDRQWGEVPTQDPRRNETTQRIGNSRLKAARRRQQQQQQQQNEKQPSATRTLQPSLLEQQHQESLWPRQRVPTTTRDDNDDDSSSSSSDNMSDDNDDDSLMQKQEQEELMTNPLQDLLTMIQHHSKKQNKKKNHRNANRKDREKADPVVVMEEDNLDEENDASTNSSCSDDDDDDCSSDSDNSGGEHGNDDDDDIDHHVDEEDNDDSQDQAKLDLFRQRFSRSPLDKAELESVEKKQTNNGLRKIALQGAESASIELQVSTPFGMTDDMESLFKLRTAEEWQSSAQGTFSSTNRVVLQRQWNRRLRQREQRKKKTDGHATNSLTMAIKSADQSAIYSFLSRYTDVFVTTSTGTSSNTRKYQREMHQIYLLHILNHVLTSRSRIARNNKLLKEQEEKNDDDNDAMEDTTEQFRDQGFTRPTVLVLLPTRGTCHQFVKDLYRLVGAQLDREQEERFEADYGMIVEEDVEGKDAALEQRRKAVLEKKGKEWNELFGDNVNQDDDFKIGISLTPKAAKGKKQNPGSSNVSVKLYSDFFKSDIIVASPLGLKMLITPEDAENEGNFDYLSSIEICLLQHSDVMLMQNWDHVNDILVLLNQEPRNNNNTDFSRVRSYLLEGQGPHWRQLILSSKFMDPSLISSFKRFGKSVNGSVKVRRKTPSEHASISNVLVPLKQVFQKVPVASFAQQSQARVDYFVKNLLPQIQRGKQKHTMVYIPSYFDFVSLRNAFLKREDIAFVSVTEYSRTSEVTRGRARFLQGRKPIMLYTGRAHYFLRHAIKGIQHLIFLGLPEHPEFYADHVNLIGDLGATTNRQEGIDGDETAFMASRPTSSLALFTKYEAHALERVVGSPNCSRMMNSPKTTFMFQS